MKNIFLLPTDKPSRLIIYSTLLNEFRLLDEPIDDWKHKRNIYITSDLEIKEGDYFWKPDCNMIFKAEYTPHKGCQKVILTTDQDLIKDGAQPIDDDFLEWFVKNPNCESVEVKTYCCQEISKNYCDLRCGKDTYKIIIPQEEPKQETLEEASKAFAWEYEEEYDNYTEVQKGFIAGAKWQAKKMYTQEEAKNIAYWAFDFYKRNDLDDEELENEFERMLNERFKNK
jgi:hypothetical protein